MEMDVVRNTSGSKTPIPVLEVPTELPDFGEIGNAGNDISGAQSDKDCTEDEDGHGAAILSLKSHVKLIPVVLSNSISVGKLRSRQPCCPKACRLKSFKSISQSP